MGAPFATTNWKLSRRPHNWAQTVAALLVSRLMRRHANKSARVHQSRHASDGGQKRSLSSLAAAAAAVAPPTLAAKANKSCATATASSPSADSSATSTSSGSSSGPIDGLDTRNLAGKPLSQLRTVEPRSARQPTGQRNSQHSSFGPNQQQQQQQLASEQHQSDGIYRVPDALNAANNQQQRQQQHSSFVANYSTRFSAGQCEEEPRPASGEGWSAGAFPTTGPLHQPAGPGHRVPESYRKPSGAGTNYANNNGNLQALDYDLAEPDTRPAGGIPRASAHNGAGPHRPGPATISVNGKQLYC